VVAAPPATAGYRGPLLIFVDRFRCAFQKVTQLEPVRGALPLVIRLGSATNDVRVRAEHGVTAEGEVQTILELPDPEHADLDELRAVLAQALVRQWRRAQGWRPDGGPGTPPAWLLAGVARHADAGRRLEDFDQIQEQWLRGRLPPLAELLAGTWSAALQHRALQAVLAAWLLERPAAEPLGVTLRRMEGGAPWPAVLLPTNQPVSAGLGALAEEWDAWMVRTLREIRQPGVTTPGQVRAFRAHLLIYPGDHDLPMPDGWRGRTLQECLGWPDTPEVRNAWCSQGTLIRLFAVGRDGTLQRVAADYTALCEALAAGASAREAQVLWKKAEEGRGRMEARVRNGVLLQDPAADAPPVVQWR
jgi:hypothetical protein